MSRVAAVGRVLGVLLAVAAVLGVSAAEPNSTVLATNEHWSFQPPVRPAIPRVKQTQWPRNTIDYFVLAKLEENQLRPSSEADRRALIRRLSFDVIGLPPTPEEISRFVSDESPAAYENLVDRLLASPHYGERWARHWLDVVRFAESDGFETNLARTNGWQYRDYIINALNEDKPYDQFVIEQLAGDSFLRDTATGFIVGGAVDRVKSPDIVLTLQQRADELHDMVATTGSTFLGLTVGCARCHKHKFDPISQTDYYAMQAMFSGVRHGERIMRLPDYPVRDAEAKQIEERLVGLSEKLEAFVQLAQVTPSPSVTAEGESSSAAAPQPAASVLLRPAVHPKRNLERFPAIEAKFVRFTILETTNNLEPCLDELEVFTKERKPRNVAKDETGAKASASGTVTNSEAHKLEHLHDGQLGNERSWMSNEPGKGWVQIEFQETNLVNKIIWSRDRNGKHVDRLAVRYKIEAGLDTNHWTVIATSDDRQPYKPGVDVPADYSAEGKGPEAEKELKQLLAEKGKDESRFKVLTDLPKSYSGRLIEPEPTYRLFRGDPMEKREVVAPATLSEFGNRIALATNAPNAMRRLALARWIVNPENPLTARVMVNRIWQHHFGEGIVATPSDFGKMGAKPSHPELLDWLANEFMARGWSMKEMHRMILLSSTYRQSSTPNSKALAVDSANRWLWRFPPQRLEAEPIRDAMLTVSGKLNLRMGGPGFDLFESNANYVKVYNSRKDFGTNEWRRMIYQSKPRVQLDDTFGAFDCPDAGQIAPKRTVSTTPLQALNLLHSSFVLQQSELFAQRLQAESQEPKAQTDRAFQLAFGREPTSTERARSVKIIQESGLPNFCRALFNASEFLYVY